MAFVYQRQELSGLGPLLSYTLEYAGVLTNVEEGQSEWFKCLLRKG